MVESTGFENRHPGNGIESSNLSSSAFWWEWYNLFMKKMNKTTAIVLIVILLVGGFYLFKKPVTGPEVEVPTDTSTLEEDNSQASETPAPQLVRQDPVAALEGKTFRLASLNGVVVSADANYTLEFEEGRLGAKFCNNMGGEYAISRGFITVPQMVSTLMFCSTPDNLMGLENFFSSLLSKGAAFSFVGPNLVLADDKNTMTFEVFAE